MLRPVTFNGVTFDAVGAAVHTLKKHKKSTWITFKWAVRICYPVSRKQVVPITDIIFCEELSEHEAIKESWNSIALAKEQSITSELNYLIQQALNAPVLVTEEVLKGFSSEDMDFEILCNKNRSKCWVETRFADWQLEYVNPISYYTSDVKIADKIRPINIIARDYLLGFTTEGEKDA